MVVIDVERRGHAQHALPCHGILPRPDLDDTLLLGALAFALHTAKRALHVAGHGHGAIVEAGGGFHDGALLAQKLQFNLIAHVDVKVTDGLFHAIVVIFQAAQPAAVVKVGGQRAHAIAEHIMDAVIVIAGKAHGDRNDDRRQDNHDKG